MSTRFDGLSSSLRTVLENYSGADQQSIFFAVELTFDSSTIRLWTGLDDLTVDSNTFTGAGSLLSIQPVEDDSELASKGMAISLSGMDDTILSYALNEKYQNRPMKIYMGFLSGNNESAGEFVIFKGRMMNMTVNDNPDGNIITLQAENRLIDLSRPSNLRYTKEAQQSLFSGDKGLDFVGALQNADITWGPRKANIAGGAFGDGGGPPTSLK